MGKKRRGDDQRRSDSQIMHRFLQNGSSSSRLSPEESPHEASLENILQQMVQGLSMNTQILHQMQVKDDKFKEMEEKYEKKFKQMEEELEKQKNECKVMKEELEKLKDNGVARSSGYSSPAQRTQPDHSQQPRLNLKILSKMKEKSYKGKIIQTETMNCIDVGLFDGVSSTVLHDHHLSSAKVQLVILKEDFNKGPDDYWSEEDFMKGLKRHGDERKPTRIENCTFNLTSGYARHTGAIILDNSNRKPVRLGVKIVGYCEERVLEGISNPFKVQEAKTDPEKKEPEGDILSTNRQQLQASTNNRSQPTTAPSASENDRILAATSQQQQVPMNDGSQHAIAQSATENGEGNIFAANLQQQMYLQALMNNLSLPTIAQSAEHGSIFAANLQQQICLQTLMNNLPLPTIAQSAEHGSGECSHTPQYFGPLDNNYQPGNSSAICGGNGSFPRFQTQSTSQQDGLFPGRGEYAADFHPQIHNQVIPNLQSGNGGPIIYNRVQLLWDEPHVELRRCKNILDMLMPLFPDKRLVHECDKLFASDYFLTTMMRVHGTVGITNRGMQRHHNRGVLIQSIEDSDSEHESALKTDQQASYQLRFVNKVCREYYIWEQIKADDGSLLKVALYTEDSLRITSGPLSSASVEIVLLHGDFNADGQDYWSPEEFSNYMLSPLSEEPPALGGDCVLTLVEGEASLSSASFQKTSSFARTGKFTMGVKMKSTLEERVQEGITQPVLVQVRHDEGSNYTCRPSDSAGGLTKLSEEVCTSLDRGSSFLTAQDTFMRSNPGDEGNTHTTSGVLSVGGAPQSPKRYEAQKRRDWNMFGLYLRNHRPPLSLAQCSGAHIMEFLRYLDQFGKTKVHAASCPFFGHPSPPAPCPCPLRQSWGSLDALVGRLRAAYEENGGSPESNPFAARTVRLYLREVREHQARSRGVDYEEKKKCKKPPQQQLTAGDSSGGFRGNHHQRPPGPPPATC